MSDRQPATEKGTADRIEADDGGYWVRLVTKQALRREGVCMKNCLDTQGYGQETAGDEEMLSSALWSLRKADGVSHFLVKVYRSPPGGLGITSGLGPSNNQPSGWCVRQLRHLVEAFRAAGATLRVPERIALTDEDGRTWRPDKAPKELRAAFKARDQKEAAPDAAGAHTRGIRSLDVVNGHLIINYSDGTIVDTGLVTGIASPPGHTGHAGDVPASGDVVGDPVSGGHIRGQVAREVSARLRESIPGVTVCETRTGPGTIEGVAIIPAGAGVFRVDGGRNEETSFPFTAPEQASVPVTTEAGQYEGFMRFSREVLARCLDMTYEEFVRTHLVLGTSRTGRPS